MFVKQWTKSMFSCPGDTAGSSTQSVNSSPAAAPSSTTVVDVTVDSAAPSSSNAKGKLRDRLFAT